MSCEYVFLMATGLWVDINQPSNLAVSSISGKLVSSGFLGKFDTLTDGCHHIESGCFSPPLNGQEQGIYQQLYLSEYYRTLFLQSQGAIGVTNWVSLREGDSSITRANPTEISKLYRALQNDANKELGDLIFSYKNNQAGPRQVDYLGIDQNGGSDNGGYRGPDS